MASNHSPDPASAVVILNASLDVDLRETRARILNQAGYYTSSAESAEEVIRLAANMRCPIVIVCNSFNHAERGKICANIRDTVIKLSQAFSALGDHSTDIFSTVKNLSILVSALQGSSDLLAQLNQNLANVTHLVANDPNEVANAVRDLGDLAGELSSFVNENRESLGTTSDKLASVSQALNDSIPDIKEVLHIAPSTLQNFLNIYQPAQGTLTGALSVNNFQNPITFLCGAIQAASRLGAEQSAKLCVQYLAPIIKNRQYNFPPLGFNPLVGATARPNEVTYSEDWMRPDYVPPQPPAAPAPSSGAPAPTDTPLAAEAIGPAVSTSPTPAGPVVQTDPAAGLPGMMLPPGGGS